MSQEQTNAIQFETAEFGGAPGSATVCSGCKQPIQGAYFQINDNPVCPHCAAAIQAHFTTAGDGTARAAARVLKALGLGLLAAFLGLALYVLVWRISGAEWGIVALAVGIMVGYAVRLGSENRGGPGYQAIALLLTYVAVALPQAVLFFALVGGADILVGDIPAEDKAKIQRYWSEANAGEKTVTAVRVVGLSLASPIASLSEDGSSVIGLVIIAIALWQAWRMTARPRLVVSGPHTLMATPPTGAPPPAPPPVPSSEPPHHER